MFDNEKISAQLFKLFSDYVTSFVAKDSAGVAACYSYPSTLATPEQLLLLTNAQEAKQAFDDIFQWMANNAVNEIKRTNCRFLPVSNSLVIASVHWDFIASGESVADFCALYYLHHINGAWHIVHVLSHDADGSVGLTEVFEF